jgi:OOP family OmpA-OmpF porin
VIDVPPETLLEVLEKTMKKKSLHVLLCLLWTLGCASPTFAADPAADVKGSKDHPRVSRFKGSVISTYKATEFGQAEILLSIPNSKKQSKMVEGKVTTIVYDVPAGHQSHEVYRSYRTQLEESGFTTLFSCATVTECGAYDFPAYLQNTLGFLGNTQPDSERYLAAQQHSPTSDTYVTLYAYFQSPRENRVILTVVEATPLKAGMVTVTAEALARDITNDGRAIVNGIYFDTDSATLKAESDPALKEMAHLLTEHPGFKVFIVGHTDNAGQAAHNLELSQTRAASVMKALVTRYRIDSKHLEARGVGSLAPVASNHTEDGRAKNRRVELVER